MFDILRTGATKECHVLLLCIVRCAITLYCSDFSKYTAWKTIFQELENCVSDKSEKLPFEPSKIAVTKYPITTIQPLYFVAPSFTEAKRKVRLIQMCFIIHINIVFSSITLFNYIVLYNICL